VCINSLCKHSRERRSRLSSEKTKSQVGSAVKSLREKSGLSQQAFATALGMALNTINRYETGSNPDLHSAMKLAGYAATKGHDDIAEEIERYITETWEIDVLAKMVQIRNLAKEGSLLARDTLHKLLNPRGNEESRREAIGQLTDIDSLFVEIRRRSTKSASWTGE
jgi:transcriptional regulator with XRE-family HTH domain